MEQQHSMYNRRDRAAKPGSAVRAGHTGDAQPPFQAPLATSNALAAELRIRIARGDWIEGEKLPSVRRLSEETGLHRLTVYKAYNLLKDEGLIESREKSGYFLTVSRRPVESGFGSVFKFRPASGGGQEPAEAGPPLPALLGELHSVDCRYQFSQALIDPLLLPNSYLAEEAKRVFDLYPRVLGTYAPLQGDEDLLAALRRYLAETCSFVPEGQELLVTNGAQEAIHLVCEALVRPGDAVLIEQPSYSVAIEIFKHRSARLVPVGIHPEGYDLEELEALMRRYRPVLFYLNPTFHNPTGRCVPAEQRKQLADLAEKYGCILVEDDAFRDIYFGTPPPPPIYGYDTAGNTIYVRSFSKYIFPGLRIGCMAARADIMRRLLTAKARSSGGTPLLNQKVFVHHFQSERSRRHLHKLRIALQLRKEAMETALEGSGWNWHSPSGGLSLWVELPEGVDPARLLADALNGGQGGETASFVPGSFFDPSGRLDRHIRLSYSLLNERRIAEGVALLREYAQRQSDR
ncbi:aminotransferase-like domain-containing protein [Saccharibacillus alkalitolerans]|uniref:PLP-dependent aminotransferase family protein n=1 Tax=Saccharibacillus alkalitolerans TaxID=2705290 RepID=A0ABX0F4B7_9BACL|nr:PLP-dependent aminotransferase family protein [Saccharibacillus alkalitolerans]NGZ74844.1 PLP-dependent aminotransferase family protein [Saccharibacillus alkalitolerans]